MRRYLRFVIPAGVILAVVVGLLLMLNSNLVYFRTPTEVVDGEFDLEADRFRLGGQVMPGSVETTAAGVSFDVGDGREVVRVEHVGAPQQLFQEGIGVVVEGSWDGAVFRSDSMLVKHDEQYRTDEGVYDPDEHVAPDDAAP